MDKFLICRRRQKCQQGAYKEVYITLYPHWRFWELHRLKLHFFHMVLSLRQFFMPFYQESSHLYFFPFIKFLLFNIDNLAATLSKNGLKFPIEVYKKVTLSKNIQN